MQKNDIWKNESPLSNVKGWNKHIKTSIDGYVDEYPDQSAIIRNGNQDTPFDFNFEFQHRILTILSLAHFHPYLAVIKLTGIKSDFLHLGSASG